MKFKEIVFDLFKVNSQLVKKEEQLYCLAHCISADFAMAGGIVVEFNKRWNMRQRLISKYSHAFPQFQYTNGFAIAEIVNQPTDKVFPVYNMVTKKNVYDQPTPETIRNALVFMREDMIKQGLNRVAMPRIGCGIDGQNWEEIRNIIKEVFRYTDIEVLICSLK